jgi:hypothetical protein
MCCTVRTSRLGWSTRLARSRRFRVEFCVGQLTIKASQRINLKMSVQQQVNPYDPPALTRSIVFPRSEKILRWRSLSVGLWLFCFCLPTLSFGLAIGLNWLELCDWLNGPGFVIFVYALPCLGLVGSELTALFLPTSLLIRIGIMLVTPVLMFAQFLVDVLVSGFISLEMHGMSDGIQ